MYFELVQHWARYANIAYTAKDVGVAIEAWQILLGENYFPR